MLKRLLLFVIDNRLLFTILGIALFLFSLFNLNKLNIEPFPDPSPAVIEITAIYNGRSAEEVEKQVIVPLETAFAGIPHMKRLNTLSLYGLGDVKVTFDYDITYEEAKQAVINRLTQANLPVGVQPVIQSNPIGEVIRFEVRAINPNVSPADLRSLANGPIARQIKTVPGIEDCNSMGGYVKEYQIVANPDKLIRYGIPVNQVITSIQNSNSNVGGNYLEQNNKTYDIRGIGQIQSLDDIKMTGISNIGGPPVKVGDLGEVRLWHTPIQGYVGLSVNGKENYSNDETVIGTALMRKNAKTIPVLNALDAKIKELNEFYRPQGIEIRPYYQRIDLVHTVVDKMIETGIIGLGLVTFIIIIFLGDLVTALIVASIVPISFMITLSIMALNGESANLISLGAVDFGIIADAAILFIENVYRFAVSHRMKDAIVLAGKDIGKPLMFSIAIIITSFIPLFTMSGAEGVLFTPMAKTYVYALTFAIILTFMFLPAVLSIVKKKEFRPRELPVIRSVIILYNAVLKVLLKNHKAGLAVGGIVLFAALASFAFLGTTFMPVMDEGNYYLRVIFPNDIALSKSHEYASQIRKSLAQYPEVTAIDSKAGRTEDGTEATGAYNTEYTIQLKPYSQWPVGMDKDRLQKIMKEGLTKMLPPETDISFSQYIADNLAEVSSGIKGENSVKVIGPDLNELDKKGKEIESILKTVPGISDVGLFEEMGQPNLFIKINREKVALYNLSTQDILNIIDMAIGSSPITQVMEGDRQVDLDIIFPENKRNSVESIKNLPVILADGSSIPLSRIADVYYTTGAFFIYRENFARFAPVKFSVTSSDFGGTVSKAKEKVESEVKLEPGYKMVWSGSYQEMKESQARLQVIVPIAILITLVILFIYFRSMRYTLTAFASALFAIGSGIAGLLITGTTLSVSSVVGFISIMGVSVMNGTVIVSHFLELCREGMEKELSIIETMQDKVKPVLMTGLVAALGLLPASLMTGVGSQVQKPLAIVVVFGLIIGTLATLFILPLLLKAIPPQENKEEE